MATYRIEILPLIQWEDARGNGVAKQIEQICNLQIDQVRVRDVYTFDANISNAEAEKIAELLYNPVLQAWKVGDSVSANYAELPVSDYVIAVGFRPGVTDNVARSLREAVSDILGRKLDRSDFVASSAEYLVYGKISRSDAEYIGRKLLANELIQSVAVLSGEEAKQHIPLNLPKVTSETAVQVNEYNLNVSDDELMEITPKSIRLRKKILSKDLRMKQWAKNKKV